MEILKNFLIISLMTAQTIGEKFYRKDGNDIIPRNVVLIYSNSNIMNKKEPNIYVVYPETTTIRNIKITTEKITNAQYSTSTTQKSNDSIVNDNITAQVTAFTETSTPMYSLLTFPNIDLKEDSDCELQESRSSTLNPVAIETQIQQITEKNFQKKPNEINSVNPRGNFMGKFQHKMKKLDISDKLTTALYNFSTSLIDAETKKYKRNEIEIQKSEKLTTSSFPVKSKIKVKKNLSFILNNVTRILDSKTLSSTPSGITKLKKAQYRGNQTTIYETDTASTEVLGMLYNSTDKRDLLLRQSNKSKKFISALMKRNKVRLSSTTSKVKSTSTPAMNINLNHKLNPIRRIYKPRRGTTENVLSKSSVTPTTEHHIKSFVKESITLFPDEVPEKYLATEWSSLKIHKVNNITKTRGSKKFSLIDIVKIFT